MSSTGKRIRFLGLFLGALLCAGGVFGWVQINPRDVTGDDVGLFLPGNSITFRIEQDGSFDISGSSDITAILNSFANIDLIPTSDATVVEGADFNLASPVDVLDGISGSDGVNRIFFFETDGDGIFDDVTLAAAFISFIAATGEITDCDIAFNDSGVDWSTFDPPDLGQILPAEDFDIESAANQEIMHCFGIDHSPITGRFDPATGLQVDGGLSGDFSLQSSVFPLIPLTIEGRSFEEDDIAAFSSLYSNAATIDAFGNISGTVLRSDGREIKGAHVVAVPNDDRTLPTVGALSGIDFSLPAGGYVISGLLPGDYLVRIEPLFGTTNPYTEDDSSFIGFDTNFAPEFFSGAAESDTDVAIADDDALPVTVVAGFENLNVDITVNTTPPPNDDFDAAILTHIHSVCRYPGNTRSHHRGGRPRSVWQPKPGQKRLVPVHGFEWRCAHRRHLRQRLRYRTFRLKGHGGQSESRGVQRPGRRGRSVANQLHRDAGNDLLFHGHRLPGRRRSAGVQPRPRNSCTHCVLGCARFRCPGNRNNQSAANRDSLESGRSGLEHIRRERHG